MEEIVKGGVDPHEFQPSPGDVELVADAGVVLNQRQGQWKATSPSWRKARTRRNSSTWATRWANSLKLKDEDKVIEDPHWWHSVANVKKATDVVRDALIAADPADKDAFTANAAAYQVKLDELVKAIKVKVAELGRDKRKLVTSHDAFQYFARDYGFKIYPIEGVSTAEEPSTRKVAELLGTIKKEKGQIRVLREHAEPEGHHADHQGNRETTVGGELYADGLGASDGDAATYIDMMHHNVNTIVDALK